MGIDGKEFKRRSIRLPGYDYGQAGAYFITVCVQGRKCLLGEIIHEEMWLNDPGKMVKSVWDEIPQHYSSVDVDAFTVMPNHIHGIIILGVGAGPRACPEDIKGQPQGVAPTLSLLIDSNHIPLPNIVRVFLKIIGRHSRVGYGNAIITNTSSAMKMNWKRSGNTLSPIPPNGQQTGKILRLAEGTLIIEARWK